MNLTELADKYMTDKGSYFFSNTHLIGHKYSEVYKLFFDVLRNENLKLFEIGIAKGSSLLMWSEYFYNSEIFGLDIDTSLIDKNRPLGIEGGGWEGRNNITIYQGSQTDTNILNQIVNSHGLFDIIIDDGSHRTEHQEFTFNHLYFAVKDGGFYIIEDIHCDRSCNSFYNKISNCMQTNSIHCSWCSLFYTNVDSLVCIIKK